MKSTFQLVILAIFVVAIIGGVILLSTYKGGDQQGSGVPVMIWGTIPSSQFTGLTSETLSGIQGLSVNYQQKTSDSFDQDLLEALASGRGPDVILLTQADILRYSDKLSPVSLDILSERAFKDSFISEASLFWGTSGALAVPFSIDPLVMYWNRTLFANAGLSKPPAYWDEFAVLTSSLTKKDQVLNVSQSTIALGEFRNIGNAKAILSAMLLQAGNPIVGGGSVGLQSLLAGSGDSAQRVLNFYSEFANPVKPSYSWNRSLPNAQSFFLSGNLAVYFGLASELKTLREKNPNLDFDVALFPQLRGAKVSTTFGNVSALGLLRSSRNKADAVKVISFLSSSKAVAFWSNAAYLPPVRRDLLAQTAPDANQTIFYRSAVSASGWLDPDPALSSQIFRDMVESITSGRQPTASSVSQADRLLNSAIKEVLPKQAF